MKFAPPPIWPPQPQSNDLHCFWLNRVDLRYYWSFNSLLPKNNIEYPQTGPPFHPTLPRSVWKNKDLFSEEKSFISCQNDLRVPSEMFHNVKLNKLWNNIDWPRKLIEFSASKPSPDGTRSTSAPPPLERCCTWWYPYHEM
jgi:hypothetical protein